VSYLIGERGYKFLPVSTKSIQTAILACEYVLMKASTKLGWVDRTQAYERLGYELVNGEYWIGLFTELGNPLPTKEEKSFVEEILKAFVAGRGEGWS
jgi:hypothetical protein